MVPLAPLHKLRYLGFPIERAEVALEVTLEPQTYSAKPKTSTKKPWVEILFTPQLHRIGEVMDPGLFETGAVELGRAGPHWLSADGCVKVGPLKDRYLSSRHLSLAWCAHKEGFELRRLKAGHLDGWKVWVAPLRAPQEERELTCEEALLVQGPSLVRVGARLCLLLDSRDEGDFGLPRLGMLGSSASLNALRRRVITLGLQLRLQAQPPNLFIHGETGTGKEPLARALHEQVRPGKPFVGVNAAAFPQDLFEAEVYGVAPRAIPGVAGRMGRWAEAEDGTFFLDEIGKLGPSHQHKLLRQLQERAFQRVGGGATHHFKGLFVSANAVDLRALECVGDELFHRVAGVSLETTPLRLRPTDGPPIFAHFLMERAKGAQGFSDWLVRPAADIEVPPLPLSLFQKILSHPWPGNIRQLISLAEEVFVSRTSPKQPFVMPRLLQECAPSHPSFLVQESSSPRPTDPPQDLSSYLEQMAQHRWDLKAAAKRLGLTKDKLRARGKALGALPPAQEVLVSVLAEHGFSDTRAAEHFGVSKNTFNQWQKRRGIPKAKERTDEEIWEALGAAGGDLQMASASLMVSERALKVELKRRGFEGL